MRLTKEVIRQLLEQNDGFKESTYFNSKNLKEHRHYLIEGGKLLIRTTGKTSWADSRYDKTFEADIDQTRRFLRSFLGALKTDGVE